MLESVMLLAQLYPPITLVDWMLMPSPKDLLSSSMLLLRLLKKVKKLLLKLKLLPTMLLPMLLPMMKPLLLRRLLVLREHLLPLLLMRH